MLKYPFVKKMGNPLQKRFLLGNWRLHVRIIPTTPSLNYRSSFNADLHGQTIACCKLQVAAVQRSMSIVMTKFQLDLHFVFVVFTFSTLACMPQKKE